MSAIYDKRDIPIDLQQYFVRAEIGLESSPDTFIAKLVAVFREVKRVLRDDGTLWVNMGDSYAGSGKGGQSDEKRSENWQPEYANKGARYGFKPKDLMGMPWRLAFALQADGWWLRQDIIWSKPNPMPESVTDRCTKAHEYIFLLSKSASYYYDHEAIKEPVAPATVDRLSQDVESQAGSDRVPGKTNGPMKAVGHIPGNKTHKGTTAYEEGDERMRTKAGLVDYATRQQEKYSKGNRKSFRGGGAYTGGQSFDNSANAQNDSVGNEPNESGKRNKRSVWTVATMPFKEAHFATFPTKLIEPCILAGCPAGGVVLDPFGGAGTTGLVADRLQRSAILIELNPAYAEMARNRINGDAPLFAAAE